MKTDAMDQATQIESLLRLRDRHWYMPSGNMGFALYEGGQFFWITREEINHMDERQLATLTNKITTGAIFTAPKE